MRNKLAGALLFASVAGCAIDDGVSESTDTQGLYGLGNASKSWGDTDGAVIPTCWVNPDAHLDLQFRVREIVRETWESYAKIWFTGPVPSLPFGGKWEACSDDTRGRKVQVQFSEDVDYRGNTSSDDNGAVVTLIADRALGANYNRFRYEVIHEFGHALGFTHEQQREDNWSDGVAAQCGKSADDPDYGNYAVVLGGINLTGTYDVNSIMNYCNPAGFAQDLSLGDIAGVRVAYGRRDIKGDIYGIDSSNQLHWYRHDGRNDGSYTWGYPSGAVVGTGWTFKNVFSAGDSDGILYAVDAGYRLTWWRHDGRVDGGFRWATGSGNVVGTGWDFTQLFGAGDGVIYGITPYVPGHYSPIYGQGYIPPSGGELRWYRHTGQDDGSFRWSAGSGNVVGTRWDVFKQVFSGGDGVIYAVTPYVPAHPSSTYGGGWIPASGGELKWYRHIGREDGSFTWAAGSGNVIGTGWGNFKKLFSGGDGVIYGVDANDQLLWYRHDGRADGTFRWSAGSGSVVGNGWSFAQLVGDD